MDPRPAQADTDTVSVSALAERIAAELRDAFPTETWVRGEIHDLVRARSGHVYFSLCDPDTDRDAGAKLSVVLMSRDRDRVNRLLRRGGGGVRMVDGTEVRIRVTVDLFVPRGQLQLRMRSIDPAFTLGQLAIARAELLAALNADGLLRANATRAVPMLPLRVGVVTSAGSAAEADVVDQLRSSQYPFRITVADVRVQGPDAPVQVAAAVAGLGRNELDVIVIARGGGATTDLAAFDTEVVARAIAACETPVITGIGHETDSSVADAVAHTAAKTPTAAAQVVIGWVADAEARAEAAHAAVSAAARRRLSSAHERLDRDVARLATARAGVARSERRRIDDLRRRVVPAVSGVLRQRRAMIDLVAARVDAADPALALARGWSITRDADGVLVRDPAAVAAGATLHTRVAGGTIVSTVDHTEGDR